MNFRELPEIFTNSYELSFVKVSDVPLMAGFLQLSPLDWMYKTEPTGTACLGKHYQRNVPALEEFGLKILLDLL